MKIVIHAGHNPDGMKGCGAVGYLKESTCARQVVSYACDMLRNNGIEVQDVTVNNGLNQQDVLDKLRSAINAANADLSISVHLNSSSNETAHGSEVYYYVSNANAGRYADTFADELGKVSGKDRGIKSGNGLYIIKNVKPTSILLELCFVSSKVDALSFDAYAYAEAITSAVCTIAGVTYNGEYVKDEDGDKYRITSKYTDLASAEKAVKNLNSLAGEDIFIISQ